MNPFAYPSNVFSRFEHARSIQLKIQSTLQDGIGSDLLVLCGDTQGNIDSLWPDEFSAVSSAIHRRQCEFAAGRLIAREAIFRLTGILESIPANSDRSPCWPAGIVGSIAHTHDTCLAVVGLKNSWSSIGIDIEPVKAIEESLWNIICTPNELDTIRQIPPSGQPFAVMRIFVAKEAFYKWFYPLRRTILDFQDVTVCWGRNCDTFSVSTLDSEYFGLVNGLKGQILTIGNYLIAYCVTRIAR